MTEAAYQWNFQVIWEYRDVFLRAMGVTLSLAGLTIILGALAGLALSLLRMSSHRVVRWPVITWVELLRAVPPLVLVVWIYYCLPILTGLTIPAFQTAVLALALYSSAFFSEIFRAGLQSIDRGLVEAASSVGMSQAQAFRRVVLPLALQRMLPPLVSQCVLVVKNTALAGYIAVADILYQGQQISMQTFRPLEVLTTVALTFLALIIPLTMAANVIEGHFRRKYYR
ncbi:amino acid ABC transporter permease [Azorhizobium sp. AG788]|uniref:amino acid ABC transporter permease n=1 Tax=Azorhizobium sp. AG788 TaxID=2183897 RepID=UPI00313A1DCC